MKFTTLCKMTEKLDVCRAVMGKRYTRFPDRTTCLRKKWIMECGH